MLSVLDAVDCFLPDRLAEPDLKAIDFETAPASGEKVSPFVNNDHHVEDHQDEKNHPDEAEDVDKKFHLVVGRLLPAVFAGREYNTSAERGKRSDGSFSSPLFLDR